VLEVVQRYSRAWRWLLASDEDRLAPASTEADRSPEALGLAEAQQARTTATRSPALLRDQGSPLADGNKRIGTLLFLEFLRRNQLLLLADGQPRIADNGMAALTLLIAESAPQQKELMIRLVIALLEDQCTP